MLRNSILIAIFALTVGGCAGGKISIESVADCGSNVSKQVCASYRAVNTLGLLQDAAIGANAQSLLNDGETKKIVEFVKSSVTVIKTSLDGWRATVREALMQLRLQLPSVVLTKYSLYFNLLDSIIGF